jgi:beta-galactosidase
MVKFSVTGAGSIGGVGNGDPSCHEPDKASQRSAFHGLCMVLVKASGSPGPIKLQASSVGLKGASMEFISKPSSKQGL